MTNSTTSQPEPRRPRPRARGRVAPNNTLKLLPTFGYYLTFIHYFGFSINPDDVNARYLSIKIKRAGAGANAGRPRQWLAKYRLRARNTFGFTLMLLISTLKICAKFTAITFTTFIALNHMIVLAHYIYDGEKALMELMLELRLTLTKFSALIFVLSWHFKQAKVRQLIKLVKSTTVHILSSHTAANDALHTAESAPDLRADTINLIARAPQEAGFARRPLNLERDGCDSNKSSGGGSSSNIDNQDGNDSQDDGDEQNQDSELGDSLMIDTAHIDRRILRWWLMCVLISAIHFSLSEAELTKSHHLWQWLADYSLHQLDNATTSLSTLMFLASFDNYIYTVHVYGTRLIGASVICIVCSLQRESIDTLRARTLEMIKAVPKWDQQRRERSKLLDQLAAAQTGDQPLAVDRREQALELDATDLPASRSEAKTRGFIIEPAYTFKGGGQTKQSSIPAGKQLRRTIDRELFFILGESCWLRVSAKSSQRPPAGYLSSSIWRAKHRLSALAHRLSSRSKGVVGGILAARPKDWRPANRVLRRLVSKGTVCATPEACENWRPRNQVSRCNSVVRPTIDCAEPNPAAGQQRATPNPTLANGAEPRETPKQGDKSPKPKHSLRPAKCRPAKHLGGSTWPADGAHFGAHNDWPLMACLGGRAESIESKLERLASKYELIRTVNARIDACFGPMLLTQYFFLFLMSCIDVVYFSLCFNPNTKTKYIIISGMILLWWPYLLLYKFASDIGTSSKRLLVSVRRLARLSLIEHYALDELNSARNVAHQATPDKQAMGIRASALNGQSAKNYLTRLSQLSAGNLFIGLYRRPPNKASQRLPEWATGSRLRLRDGGQQALTNVANNITGNPSKSMIGQRANIINKLDHVFEPSNLSVMGIMTIDKFYLLNFAKIVITASVMIIQFISN